MKLRFSRHYFLLALILFIVEVLIALYLNDPIVRPYVGDVLVVMLIYYSIRTVFDTAVIPTILAVLAFAYLIELLQYSNLIRVLGWQGSRLANVILGNRFEWIDLVAYTLGAAILFLTERKRHPAPVGR